MPFRILVALLLLPTAVPADERRTEYYRRAVPAAQQFVQRLEQAEPAGDFTVYTLFDNIALLVAANADLLKEQRPSLEPVPKLLQIAEEMQDKNPQSPTFGNFRWYWSNTGITDPNAAEFAAARMLSICLDTPNPLTKEAQNIIHRMLERSAHVCLNRRIHADYTNIALYNAIHLILIGQILDHPEITQEGKRRLQNIVASIWDHGIFEYNSPAYYFIDIDTLQLGLRHVSDPSAKQIIHTMLELFWTDLSLHWYQGGLRLAGAQSRTYNYLYGTSVQMTRVLSFAGLAPYDHRARYNAVLNSYRALYQPPPEITKLNSQYPRHITRNWGSGQGEWAVLHMFDDIALGTAGAVYDSKQNMVQVIDIPDYEETADSRQQTAAEDLADWQFKPRSYFIADGRGDPYGAESSPTGSGGQQKALHLDALWFGAQRTVDSLGIALYPPKTFADPLITNVQSHFVVRQPESVWIEDKPMTLLPHQPVNIGNQPVIFRYKTCAFGIRAVWARHQSGQPAEVFLLDDGNAHGVYRLTVEHGTPIKPLPEEDFAGTAFWIRIGSHMESEEQFSTWRKQFVSAQVNRLDVNHNDVDIEVAGQEGIVSVRWKDSVVTTEPAAPLGILTLGGKDLGRSLLEQIPAAAAFARRYREAVPIVIDPLGTYWEAETGCSFFEGWIEPDASASGGFAARINDDVSWQLQIEPSGRQQAAEYVLWGRVQTPDPQHDSFFVETANRLPDGSFMCRSLFADWHLGTCADWTWVRFPVPICCERGVVRLTLKPREYEGRIDQFFLTADPVKRP